MSDFQKRPQRMLMLHNLDDIIWKRTEAVDIIACDFKHSSVAQR